MSDSDRTLTILYATETGTAQDAANRIARACRQIHITPRVLDMAHYPLSDLIHEQLLIYVVSTTGSGQEPRSMIPLWTMLLRSDLPTDLFEDINFCVFSLGDSSYEKFCWPGKKLSRRMESLGAFEFCLRGEGDEQHTLGIDGALDPWITQLREALLDIYPLPPGLQVLDDKDKPPPRVEMKTVSTPSARQNEKKISEYKATVKCNKRTTAEDWYQDVRHIELSFDEELNYQPGDVAVIYPEISDFEVDSFLIGMGWANIADEPYEIIHNLKDQTLPERIPKTTTLREIFTRHLNINAVPRRSFFDIVRHFSGQDLEREKLEEFTTAEGAEDLYDYTQKVRRTIREVLEEFRSVRIPIDYIFDVFPPLRPRQFSIASSSKRHPKEIHLCVAMVNYRTRLKIPRRGVCTSYLATLRPGDTLPVGIEKGMIKLPPDPKTPVICIGPGTGIAPIRAVIQHRLLSKSQENTLYFGCRSATKDQHYASEWAHLAESGDITYRLAPSRDGPEGVKRRYVQDLMREDAEVLWNLIEEKGAWVYISGSSNKMPAAVKAAIKYAIEKQGGRTEEEAGEYVARLERGGRLFEESWS